MEEFKRLISSVLAVATVMSLSSCTKDKESNHDNEVEYVVEELSDTTNDLYKIVNQKLYDETIDYQSIIKEYLALDYDLKQNIEEKYYKALYMSMLNSNTSIEVYFEELNSLLVLGVVPMYLDDDLWNTYFKNLIAMNNEYESPSLYDMFSSFAQYIHEISCNLEHYVNDYCAYECEELLEEYEEYNNIKTKKRSLT